MALNRNPGSSIFDPFFGNSIFDAFDNAPFLGRSAFPSLPQEVSAAANPRVDWVETPEAHVFKADLPGLKKEEVKVQVTDDKHLSISGERSKEEMNENDSYRHVECSHGKFFRQFKLPENAKPHEVAAKLEKGVLTVTVPKSEINNASSQVRDVQITN